LAQASFQFRGIILHPPPNRDVVDQKPALSQEFLYVAIREREAQIPADGQEKHPGSLSGITAKLQHFRFFGFLSGISGLSSRFSGIKALLTLFEPVCRPEWSTAIAKTVRIKRDFI